MSDESNVFSDVAAFLSFSAEKAEAFILRGMLKANRDQSLVDFSPTMSCSDWIAVERSSIAKITYLGQTQCEEHSHPIVIVEFANAQSNSLQGLKVVRSLQARLSALSHSMQEAAASGAAASIKPNYVGPCGGNWACQNGSVISCTPGRGRPFENINTNECYCIPC